MNQKLLTDVSGIVGLTKTNGFSYELIIDLKVNKILQILSVIVFEKNKRYHVLTEIDMQDLKGRFCN